MVLFLYIGSTILVHRFTRNWRGVARAGKLAFKGISDLQTPLKLQLHVPAGMSLVYY